MRRLKGKEFNTRRETNLRTVRVEIVCKAEIQENALRSRIYVRPLNIPTLHELAGSRVRIGANVGADGAADISVPSLLAPLTGFGGVKHEREHLHGTSGARDRRVAERTDLTRKELS